MYRIKIDGETILAVDGSHYCYPTAEKAAEARQYIIAELGLPDEAIKVEPYSESDSLECKSIVLTRRLRDYAISAAFKDLN
jgi:hypothetical protein